MEWPSEEDLSWTGLRREDVERFWVDWHPLAASVGLEFSFSTGDDGVTTLRFASPR